LRLWELWRRLRVDLVWSGHREERTRSLVLVGKTFFLIVADDVCWQDGQSLDLDSMMAWTEERLMICELSCLGWER